jgi:hypothetical protein
MGGEPAQESGLHGSHEGGFVVVPPDVAGPDDALGGEERHLRVVRRAAP